MKTLIRLALFSALVVPMVAAPAFRAEAGASVFFLRQHGNIEPGPAPLSVTEPKKLGPYIGGTLTFSERFDLRFAYHRIEDVTSTADFASPTGLPPPAQPVFIRGHYRDDIHILSVMPEFTWQAGKTITLGFAPQLNWVASEGVVSYSTNSPLILLMAPRERDDEDFTLGAAARLRWTLGARSSMSLGYQYSDLAPSFHRRAHVVSAGLEWRF